MTEFRRIALKTGVTLNVALAGDPSRPPVIMLHGFPESHRTWRELVPRLSDDCFLIMPDQRGFAASDQPQEVGAYKTDKLVDDIFALAEALGIDRFTLVGHDWGGAIAWAAAIRGDRRLGRLAVINAPHPVIFQKSLIESAEQRAASQYMNFFKLPGAANLIERMGYETFFEKTFGTNANLATMLDPEKQQYIADWSQPGAMKAMLNWYRASRLIIPPPLVTVPLPDWILGAFPKVNVPTLVVWGMKDSALLPVQLEGLDTLVPELTIVPVPDAGHFVPWQAPEPVAEALRPFLGAGADARAAQA